MSKKKIYAVNAHIKDDTLCGVIKGADARKHSNSFVVDETNKEEIR
jgi:hypothetical protein